MDTKNTTNKNLVSHSIKSQLLAGLAITLIIVGFIAGSISIVNSTNSPQDPEAMLDNLIEARVSSYVAAATEDIP